MEIYDAPHNLDNDNGSNNDSTNKQATSTVIGTVAMVEKLGASVLLHITLAKVAEPIVIQCAGNSTLQIDAQLSIAFDAHKLYFFDALTEQRVY